MDDEWQEYMTPDEKHDFIWNLHDRAMMIQGFLERGEDNKAAEAIYLYGNNHMMESSSDMLATFYTAFTDDLALYRCIVDVYTNDGYMFPKSVIRKAKQIAATLGDSERLGDIPEGNTYTIYRGTNNPYESPRYAISWTLDMDTAVWFAHRQGNTHPIVYKATITRRAIIAYTNCRGEQEVLQYGNARNIERLEMAQAEVTEELDRYNAAGKAWNEQIWNEGSNNDG